MQSIREFVFDILTFQQHNYNMFGKMLKLPLIQFFWMATILLNSWHFKSIWNFFLRLKLNIDI